MNAIQIVRETEQFPEMERISENEVNFFFDHSERPYGENTQYMAVMITVDYPKDEEKEDDINEVKALALPDIKEYRIKQIGDYDSSTNVNSFFIGGQSMWLTVDERQQLATQINANKTIGRESMTKWFGGHEFTFTIEEWEQMLVALEVYAGDALNVTESHKAAIEALDDVDDVINYDITADYPEKLYFGEEPETTPEITLEPEPELIPEDESEQTPEDEELVYEELINDESKDEEV